ncbi:MAG: peptidylprolyl isomerase [Frankiaceae bacterium]|nr:peptidylprolyl isomerase [Frankiaceae bacterium]
MADAATSAVPVLRGSHRRSTVAEDLYATLSTSEGDIRVQLFPNHAPKTVANFVELSEGTREWTDPRTGSRVTAPLYDGTVFHRVISGFMIQGGDPLGTGTGGPGYRFNDEIHPELAFTKPYLLAMANAGPGTNGSQFFITVEPTSWLTGKHTIFGEVADGDSRAVVDKIAAVQTGQMDRPVTDVVINKIAIDRVAG